MRYIITIILSFSPAILFSQVDINSTLGLPRVQNLESGSNAVGTNNTIIINETNANVGNLVYNTTDNLIYTYDGTNWVPVENTDNQFDDEVPLRTPLNVNGNPITDPTRVAVNETNVQQVIQAIAPITSKNGRVFYPPSIQIDASVNGAFSINLYDQYVAQHTGAGIIRSTDGIEIAPDIPIYNANELYYYVTFADPAVFGTITINEVGLMNYTIIGQPLDFNSLINVVFVVK